MGSGRAWSLSREWVWSAVATERATSSPFSTAGIEKNESHCEKRLNFKHTLFNSAACFAC